MFYTYILKSLKTGRYYIGCTKDVDQRIHKHNTNQVRSTKAYTPWEIMYIEKYKTLKEARRRERKIKNWKSRKMIEKLINGPIV